uniref:dTDP-4-dehydrorhamnose 3,5-epimerase family protein n=1 Tax=Algoriphagus sp. TaxID=1872435 RepID=UPI0040476C98
MIFKQQLLNGVFLIEAKSHHDERGLFRRHYCENELKDNGIDFSVKQGNISENTNKLTMRGFHYQNLPSKESKIISCVTGSIYNVIIDMRRDSPTFLEWQEFSLSADGRESLYIPVGCANAFLTLEDNTRIHYYMNDFFSTDSLGFRYNDPAFSIPWPAAPQHISGKDMEYPDLNLKTI